LGKEPKGSSKKGRVSWKLRRKIFLKHRPEKEAKKNKGGGGGKGRGLFGGEIEGLKRF